MRKSRLLSALCAGIFYFATLPSHATLVSKLGGQVVYDDDYGPDGITWVVDANLALTEQFGLKLSTRIFDHTANTVGSTGRMTWDNAVAWIAGMNAFEGGNGYLGCNDWRLPITQQPDASCYRQSNPGGGLPPQGFGLFCKGSEMGHLYHVERVTTAAPGLFSQIQGYSYWSGTENAINPSAISWHFSFANGYQASDHKEDIHHTWAVRSGDVTVPEPPMVWLFSTGLIVFLGAKNR